MFDSFDSEPTKRKARSYDEAAKSVLRLKNKYICPICSEEEKPRVHTIGSKQMNRCMRKIFPHRGHPGNILYLNERGYAFVGSFVPKWPHRMKWVTMLGEDRINENIRSKYPDIHSELDDLIHYRGDKWKRKDFNIENDYWTHPSGVWQEIWDEISKKQEELDKGFQGIWDKIKHERKPLGALWKSPDESVTIRDKEAEKIRPVLDKHLISEYYIENAEWKDGYIVKYLDEENGVLYNADGSFIPIPSSFVEEVSYELKKSRDEYMESIK